MKPVYFFDTVKESVKHWYLPLIFGIVFVGIGVWIFFEPLETYFGLSILFSLSFLLSGILETTFALANRDRLDNWGWTLVFGLTTLGIGVLLTVNPDISLVTLPLYVGFLVLFRSLGAIGRALDLKKNGVLEWGSLMVIGVLGTLFSGILIWNPLFAGVYLVFLTAITLISIGIHNIYLSIRLKKLQKAPHARDFSL